MPQLNGTVPPTSPLNSADYNPVDHLNAIFSHPSSLSSIAKTSDALGTYQDELDEEIAALVQHQSINDVESVKSIRAAKDDLAELFPKVEDVRARAMQTEEAITEMTADIKRLDNTKKNLTLSMTALKRLQMLTTAYEQLRGLSSSRQYKECTQLLQAVIQLMTHFKSYRSIDQIATLGRNVSDLQRELLEQVCEDFEVTFAKAEVAQRRGVLAEACLVMDALGDNARSRLITWYCNTQLREYRQVFRGNEEAGSLDNISRRYAWFKRMLKTYDDEHAVIFPANWRMNEMLANAFCEGTRDDFKSILSRSIRKDDGLSLDVDLLLSCLQETLDFEHSLERRFNNASRASIDTLSSDSEKAPVFSQAISEAFEPYLSVWVEAQDKKLSTMIPQYRQQPPKPPDEEFSPQMVVPSSIELFNFYRLTLAQCAKLSTGARLVELSKVFAKYLDQYAQQVLLYYVSERPSGQTPSRFPQLEDTILVLNTADYCFNTCTQLEEKIKGRIDEGYKEMVDLQSQADAFMGIASATVRALVRRVEMDIERTWREMRNTGWSKMEMVGDQSSWVAEMLSRIKERASEVLGMLHKQQYARAFCDNLVDSIANAFIVSIFQCKPISEVGAEQMLLDSYALKKGFEELLNINAQPNTSTPAGYIRRVNQTMARLDPILKTLQVRPSPPEALVQAYLIHIADRSDTNFRKILDLKGLRKQDQSHLLELFQAHRASPRNEKLPPTSALLAPLAVTGGNAAPGGGGAGGAGGGGPTLASGIGHLSSAATLSTSNLPARFDPSTFGSAIMNAARDGVDRLGTPTLGTTPSHTPAGAMTPPPQQQQQPPPAAGRASFDLPTPGGTMGTTNLNENLRNIGKFFKRDIGGFGGRFGGGGSKTAGE
ncbi:MAG: hypothetical protein L6R36_002098 [Xanthoria steineri]|nr:MAG: hypothetical protein L6R36_002098 [Xanthoria steineri]